MDAEQLNFAVVSVVYAGGWWRETFFIISLMAFSGNGLNSILGILMKISDRGGSVAKTSMGTPFRRSCLSQILNFISQL